MLRIQPCTSKAIFRLLLNRGLPCFNEIQKCHSSLVKEPSPKTSKSRNQNIMSNGHKSSDPSIFKPRKLPKFSTMEAPEKQCCNAKNDDNATKTSAAKKKKLSYKVHKDIAKDVEELPPLSSNLTAKVYVTSVMPEPQPQTTSSSTPKAQPLTENMAEPNADLTVKASIGSTLHSKPELKSKKKVKASVAPPKQTVAIFKNSTMSKEIFAAVAAKNKNTPVEKLSVKNTEDVVLKKENISLKNEFVEIFPTTKKQRFIKPVVHGSSRNFKADFKLNNKKSKTKQSIAQQAPKLSEVTDQKTSETLGHQYMDQETDIEDKAEISKLAVPAASNAADESVENNTTYVGNEVELEELISFSTHHMKKQTKEFSKIFNNTKLPSNENIKTLMEQFKTFSIEMSENEINTETSGKAQDLVIKNTLQGNVNELKIMNDTLKSLLQTFSDNKFVVQLHLSNVTELRDLLLPFKPGDLIQSPHGKSGETEDPKDAIEPDDKNICDVASQHAEVKDDHRSLEAKTVQITDENPLRMSIKSTVMYLIQAVIANSMQGVKIVIQKIVKTIKIN